jgi:hypothetical protein
MPEANTRSDADSAADASKVPMTEAVASAQEAVASAQRETLHNIGAAGSAMLGGLTEAKTEISDFIIQRIREDVDTHAEMLGCRTLDDVRVLQTRFFKTALDQYAGEASRLMKIGTDMMERSLVSRSH